MKLINIGFGNLVAANRLLAVVSPDSAPIKRVIQEARDRQMLIDASYGRKTASVLLMDTDHVILSAMTPEVIGQRSTEQLRKYEEDENEYELCFLRRIRRRQELRTKAGHGVP